MFISLDDSYISSYAISMSVNTSYQFSFKVDCINGMFLKADPVAGLTVEAKISADPDFATITGGGIDLSPYADTRQEFDFLVTADGTVQLTQVRIYTE